MSNRLILKPDGPLIARGDIQILDADGNLIAEGQEFFLCRCGSSKDKPYCDGTHKKLGFHAPAEFNDDRSEPPDGDGPLKITVRPGAMLIAKGPMTISSEAGDYSTTRNNAALCRCGRSEKKPFCDTSHKSISWDS